MRKMSLLALILVMAMALSVPAFAQVTITGPETHGMLSPITGANIQQGQGQSLNNSNSFDPTNNNNIGNGIGNFSPSASARVTNDIRNTNANWNSNTQGQLQGQVQGQNNGQVISPSQSVSFSSPVQLPGINTPGLAELNYRDGKTRIDTDNPLWNFSTDIPKYDPRKFKVVGQVDECANEPIKRFFGKASDLLNNYKGKKGLAYVITASEAGKTLQGGVNLNGMGTGVGVSGTGGGGGGGLLGFQGGIAKSWDLYTIIILEVI